MKNDTHVSPINGQPVPEGKPFVAGDSRAKEAQEKSVKARKKNADLRKLATQWMESPVGVDNNGNELTGAELMITVAAKKIAKGDPRFWELLRDTAGQKPVERVMVSEVEQSVIDEVERMVKDAAE